MGYQLNSLNPRKIDQLKCDLTMCFHFDLHSINENDDKTNIFSDFSTDNQTENHFETIKETFLNIVTTPTPNISSSFVKNCENLNTQSINSRSTTDFDLAKNSNEKMFGKVSFETKSLDCVSGVNMTKSPKIDKEFTKSSMAHLKLKRSNFFLAADLMKDPIAKTPLKYVLRNLFVFKKSIAKYHKNKRFSKQKQVESVPFLQTTEKVACCNCKSSNCIKMYCECFKTRGYCVPQCKCYNCKNNRKEKENELKRFSFSTNFANSFNNSLENLKK